MDFYDITLIGICFRSEYTQFKPLIVLLHISVWNNVTGVNTVSLTITLLLRPITSSGDQNTFMNP